VSASIGQLYMGYSGGSIHEGGIYDSMTDPSLTHGPEDTGSNENRKDEQCWIADIQAYTKGAQNHSLSES